MNRRQVDFLKQMARKIPELIKELSDETPKTVYVLGERKLDAEKYAELTIQAQSFCRGSGQYPNFSTEIIENRLWQLKLNSEWLKKNQSPGNFVQITVVRANCEKHAREIASDNCLEEGPEAWLMPEASWCFQLLDNGDIGVIVQSVNRDSIV